MMCQDTAEPLVASHSPEFWDMHTEVTNSRLLKEIVPILHLNPGSSCATQTYLPSHFIAAGAASWGSLSLLCTEVQGGAQWKWSVALSLQISLLFAWVGNHHLGPEGEGGKANKSVPLLHSHARKLVLSLLQKQLWPWKTDTWVGTRDWVGRTAKPTETLQMCGIFLFRSAWMDIMIPWGSPLETAGSRSPLPCSQHCCWLFTHCSFPYTSYLPRGKCSG